MPYKDISELPEPVRNSLPQHGQEIYMAAYNSAAEQGKDEETCAKIAWGAVKRSYEKGADGKWKVISNLEILISNSEITNTDHDAILNTLDRWHDIPNVGRLYFTKEAFQQSIQEWEDVPIIFAKDHPDLNLFATNREQALKNINGLEVGKITTPKVDIIGHPRAMGTLRIDNPLLDNLIKLGKISHSTAFIANSDLNGKITRIIPNHLLVFVEDNTNIPRDRGAFILNKEEGTETDIQNKDPKKPYGDVEYADPGYQEDGVHRYPLDTEAHVRAAWSYINMPKNQNAYTADQLANIKAKIRAAAKKHGIEISNKETEDIMTEDKEVELTKQLEISNKEKETLTGQVEGLQKEIANKDARLKVFEQKETERKKVETETRWQTIKNKIPKGLTHKPEDETILRKQFEEQTQEFAVRMTEFMNKPELPGEEGNAITNTDADPDSPGPGAKIGEYDAHTGAWK